MLKGMEKVVVEAEASVPGFFTPERVNAIRNVFDAMVSTSTTIFAKN